jgi:hypothetical protein
MLCALFFVLYSLCFILCALNGKLTGYQKLVPKATILSEIASSFFINIA